MSVVPPILTWYLGPEKVLSYLPFGALDAVPTSFKPIESIVVLIFIYYCPHMIRVFFTIFATGKIDNHDGRKFLSSTLSSKATSFWHAKILGIISRSQAAHLNIQEGIPLYVAGVLAAVFTGVNSEVLAKLCNAYLVLRALYVIVYIAQGFYGPLREIVALIRSVLWMSATIICCIMLLLASAKAES